MKLDVIRDFLERELKLKLGENSKNKMRWQSKAVNTDTKRKEKRRNFTLGNSNFTQKTLNENENIFLFNTLNFWNEEN